MTDNPDRHLITVKADSPRFIPASAPVSRSLGEHGFYGSDLIVSGEFVDYLNNVSLCGYKDVICLLKLFNLPIVEP